MSFFGRENVAGRRSSAWGTTETNRGRGGWARRSSRGNSWHNRTSSRQEQPTLPPQPLGKLLLSINKAELEEDQYVDQVSKLETENNDTAFPGWIAGFRASYSNDDVDKRITNYEYVASYSWLNGPSPTIFIPGKPPAWTPLKAPQRLKQDSGDFFRDPNAARYPSYPSRPAVEAVLKQNPDFPTESVQIFACGSTMGNLLRFVRGISKPFRFDIELVGETVFFIRKERDPKELIPGVYGYGHTFPEAYTTWDADVKGSESHQRIVSYDFGGIKCLVRFESDGYLKHLVHTDEATISGSNSLGTAGDETINAALTAINLGSAKQLSATEAGPSSGSKLIIQSAGQRIQQNAVYDLKTRTAAREIDMSEMYPRLWVSQIPNFIVAYHTRGEFDEESIHVKDVRDDVFTWQADNQDAVKRLHMLLHLIIAFAQKSKPKREFEVCRSELDIIEIREQEPDGRHVLPGELLEEWSARQVDVRDGGGGLSDDGYEQYAESQSKFDNSDLESEVGSEKDNTACSAEDCGYCGHCHY